MSHSPQIALDACAQYFTKFSVESRGSYLVTVACRAPYIACRAPCKIKFSLQYIIPDWRQYVLQLWSMFYCFRQKRSIPLHNGSHGFSCMAMQRIRGVWRSSIITDKSRFNWWRCSHIVSEELSCWKCLPTSLAWRVSTKVWYSPCVFWLKCNFLYSSKRKSAEQK